MHYQHSRFQTSTLKLFLLFAVILVASVQGQAQERRVKKVLEEVRVQLVLGKGEGVNEDVLFKQGNEAYLLAELKEWFTDTTRSIRQQAISYTGRVGLRTIEPAIKQDAVRLLVQKSADKDEALANSAIGYLTHFTRRDFTKDACDSVRSIIHRQPLSFDKLIRIAGFLDLKDQIPFLDSIFNSGKIPTKTQWNIQLTLARMGNTNSAKYCLDLAKIYPVDDNIIFYILPDLIYTRQKMVYDYLLEILYSDDPKCSSPNPYYSGAILCGYRVMEGFAAVVNGFPLKTNSSGEIITNDYEKSLKVTRKWFDEHKADYELNFDVY
jgi:hypothetical protein